jgi:hypothetical protein
MGKSALVKTFMKDVIASMTGIVVRASSASQFEKGTAFFVWKQIFESVLSVYNTRKKESGRGATTSVVSQEVSPENQEVDRREGRLTHTR